MATIPLKDITFPGLDNTYTIPEIDDTLSTAGKAADAKKTGDEINGLEEDLNELNSNFADIQSDGVVPTAEQILSDKGVTDSVPYHYRKTGGDGADRLYDQIVGGTVCWNQLIENGDEPISVSANTNTQPRVQNSVPFISGHKMLVLYQQNDTLTSNTRNTLLYTLNGSTVYQSGNANRNLSKGAYSWLFSPASSGNADISLWEHTLNADCTFTDFQFFDLTAMFGSTIADYIYQLEQTTAGAGVAFFKSLFPNDYYPYNAGELVSVSGLSAHKMVGFNQWDEEWEVGTYAASTSTVEEYADNTHIMSKNPIRVIAGATYYINSAGKNVHLIVADANGNVLWRSISLNNGTFNVPQNGAYVYFNMAEAYGTTYKHDICINLSDPAKNGTYEPYKAHSYPLDSTLTLRGIPKLVDGKMCFDGDTYDADGTVTRKYGVVDLGTLNWSYSNGFFRTNPNPEYKYPSSQLSTTNAICTIYTNTTWNAVGSGDKEYAFSSATTKPEIIIKDTSYSDAATFKAAMSGVMLVYELATPTAEEADPYQHLQQCDPNGTEEYVSTGIVSVGHNSFYPENLRAKVEQLPWNFANLIAPTESTFTATRNYTTGALFIVSNVLYKATSNIANGGTITPNTNCTATTLAEIISALA